MTGYTRQSVADIVAGQVVTAAPLNAEFNTLEAAFAAVTGHTHDGTTGSGPKINLTTSVSGILPVANGGTGSSSLASFVTLTDIQTLTNKTLTSPVLNTPTISGGTIWGQAGSSLVSGDILYATSASTITRLAKGTDGQVLTLASGVPSWSTNSSGDVTLNGVETLTNKTLTSPVINGGTVNNITNLTVAGTSSAGASISLYEDTDNGTNFVAVKAPDNITTSTTFILPSIDGSSGDVLTTDGAGNLSFVTSSSISEATVLSLIHSYSLII